MYNFIYAKILVKTTLSLLYYETKPAKINSKTLIRCFTSACPLNVGKRPRVSTVGPFYSFNLLTFIVSPVVVLVFLTFFHRPHGLRRRQLTICTSMYVLCTLHSIVAFCMLEDLPFSGRLLPELGTVNSWPMAVGGQNDKNVTTLRQFCSLCHVIVLVGRTALF